jgi:heat shock protein HslJ
MSNHPLSSTAAVLAILAMTLAISGCAKDGEKDIDRPKTEVKPVSPPSNPTSVTGTDWQLTHVGDTPAQPREQAGRPWIRLDPSDKRRVTGNTGVNLLSGTYELSGGAIKFGPMITTKRAGASELMQQESRFLKALESAVTAHLEGNKMELRDAAGATVARFEAVVIPR